MAVRGMTVVSDSPDSPEAVGEPHNDAQSAAVL